MHSACAQERERENESERGEARQRETERCGGRETEPVVGELANTGHNVCHDDLDRDLGAEAAHLQGCCRAHLSLGILEEAHKSRSHFRLHHVL